MKYLAFIWSQGRSAPEELAVMQRELPGYIEEMERRGVRLLGRELDLPETAALVRVRDGETLVSDGPFAETKELVAGIDLLDCADMDEAAEVMAKGPVTWFKAVEIRPSRPPRRPAGTGTRRRPRRARTRAPARPAPAHLRTAGSRPP